MAYEDLVKEVVHYDYDKDLDGYLWQHPLMYAMMAILERDGRTPLGKDTQICLVKAALRATKEAP